MTNNDSVTPKNIARRDFIKKVGYTAASTAVLAQTLPGLAQNAAQPIVVALVGCAHIHTPSYVGILKSRADVKVKCVWDHDRARAEKNAAQFGCPVVDDLKVIWSDPEIKAVVICSETNRHRELVLAAADAKKHMFAEKPLGFTSEDSQAMASAVEKANVLFTTGYFMRTDPQILFLKAQVEKENFGKITRVRASNCHNGSLGHWFDTDWRWMADPKIAGVGAFGDLGTHKLDILMWMFGDVDAITADIKVVTGNYGDCDESGEALMKFKNGITGTLGAGWVDVADPVTLLISGTEGHAHIDMGRLFFASRKVEGADGRRPWTDLPPALPLPMNQFIDAVGGKSSQTLVTPKEAAARVSVMEAAYKGARGQVWAKPA
ncbi:MAG TPA: Gfo/Idh/MocA family oxidoreductase [Verrucomicrobiae bacterium]|jgi:predicted dehydrogenase|nr:Gfo/Idh/MocA family oxidoreductase [Verrucomicrobiae bacterium]